MCKRNKKTRFAREAFLCQSTTSCALYRINGDNSNHISGRKGRDRPVNRIDRNFLETAHLLQHGRDTIGKPALVLLRSGKFPLIYMCFTTCQRLFTSLDSHINSKAQESSANSFIIVVNCNVSCCYYSWPREEEKPQEKCDNNHNKSMNFSSPVPRHSEWLQIVH